MSHYIERAGIKRAAGCLIMAISTGRLLMSCRSERSPSPGTWAGWGGSCEYGEFPDVAAKREVFEETGLSVQSPLQHLHHFEKSGFQFDTYLTTVRDEFEPRLTDETAAFAWVGIDELPEPLHDGMKDLLSSRVSSALLRKIIDDRYWFAC